MGFTFLSGVNAFDNTRIIGHNVLYSYIDSAVLEYMDIVSVHMTAQLQDAHCSQASRSIYCIEYSSGSLLLTADPKKHFEHYEYLFEKKEKVKYESLCNRIYNYM